VVAGGAGGAGTFRLFALVDILFDMTDDGFGIDALAGVVIGKRGLDRLLCQYAAVQLGGREAIQRLHYGTVGKGKGL